MSFYAYILYSKSAQKYYTGSCEDVSVRVARHNNSMVRSTKYGVPWTLIWHRECATRSVARKLELKIKKRGAKRFLQDLKKDHQE